MFNVVICCVLGNLFTGIANFPDVGIRHWPNTLRFSFLPLFHSFFSTNIIIIALAFPLHLYFSLASCLSLLMPHRVWLVSAYLPLLHNKTMMDLITPVTHLTASFISGFFSRSISHFLWAYLSFFPLSFPIIFDEQENMLTCVPSVLQIKTLAQGSRLLSVLVHFGAGKQVSWISPGFAWLLRHVCDTFTMVTLGDSVL